MRILFLTSRFPYPLEKGDKLRAFHQIKYLSQNHEIILACTSDVSVSKADITHLREYCKEIHIFPLSRTIRFFNLLRVVFRATPFQVGYFYHRYYKKLFYRIIKNGKPDVIFCQLIRMAEYVKRVKQVPKVLDYMDAFSEGSKRRAQIAKWYLKPLLWWDYYRLKNYEADVYKCFQQHYIISEQDKALLTFANARNIEVLSNGVDAAYFCPSMLDTAKTYDAVFTGNMAYSPNVIAAQFLVKQVWPKVLQHLPNAKLLLAGAMPNKEIKELESNNVVVSGWLPDIRNAYYDAKVFVAPLSTGTGLQNKLLEAMACEVPCITSALAANALKANSQENILIASTADEYAAQILTLIKQPEQAESLAKAGRKFVLENFSWQKINDQLNTSLQVAAKL